jgi:hypothetical protein|tara:strand:+ start:33787 stop:34632 length:846 start_codon:yes stop_codon:yes gene_type:complete
MLGTYYYHEIVRKTIISFGTLFNDIHVRHQDKSGNDISDLKVPLAYGPVQKFLARLEQQAELNKAVQINLPRMSFEMTSIAYDSTRKSSLVQTFKTCDDGSKVKKVFMPVPYNIGFQLNILSKLNDDSLQILEQILPVFQPHFNLTIDLVESIGEKRDIPIILESVSFQDDYEGSFDTRRALIHTLNFTAKTYLFGPIADSSDGLIRKVQVDMYADTNRATAKREMRYTVEPIAKVDKNNDGVIDAADKPLLMPGDNFGFDEEWEFLGDGKTYSPTRQTDI